MASQYSIVEKGQLFSGSYRAYFKDAQGKLVSPFHDIPLMPAGSSGDVLTMVVEVSRWSNAKMEINKDEPLNPIKQDVKKGKMRFVGNIFPHHGYPWNYGAIPQTWENPADTDSHTGSKGDNDPLDVCDVSNIVSPLGSVINVKVLGILAMIDEGETDWKLIVVNVEDEEAGALNDIADVEKLKPGLLDATIEWFKTYKVPDGKPKNQFAFNEQFKDKEFAKGIVKSCHECWKSLIEGKVDNAGISLANTTGQSGKAISQEEAAAVVEANEAFGSAAPLPSGLSKVFFVNSNL